MSSQTQIAIDKVSHIYRPPRGRPVLALEDVSLEVRNREFLALLGPSGCGKSTLLYLIGGFLPIERGAIVVNGKPVAAPGPDRGIVFQHFALFPWKTVRANITYGLERQRMPREERERARAVLHRSGRPDRLRGQLSVATVRRHEAAHGARSHARLRPEHSVDGRAVRRARRADPAPDADRNCCSIWQRTPKTVIFVTHDVQEAVYLADRVAVMSARPGRIKTIVDTRFEKNDAGLFKAKEFVDKVDELWNLVRDEAIKAQEARPS